MDEFEDMGNTVLPETEELGSVITPQIEETFNLVGLSDYNGSLVGKQVVPNGSPDPREPFGAGYDLTFHHHNLKAGEPMTVKADFEKDKRRFLTVEDHKGKTADVLASRLVLPEL